MKLNLLFRIIIILLFIFEILVALPIAIIHPANTAEQLSSTLFDAFPIHPSSPSTPLGNSLNENGHENTDNMNIFNEEIYDFEDESTLFSKSHYLKELTNDLLHENMRISERSAETRGSNDYSIGDTLTIIAYNDPGEGEPLTMDVPATLRAAGQHCLIWVDNNDWGNPVSQEDVNHLVDVFDNRIYPMNTEFFGFPADIDGDGVHNVSILLLELSDYGTAGYFWNYAQTQNGFEIFFLDNDAGPDNIYLDGTLAHEFQHMIHDAADSSEFSWVDEGAAVFAESLNSFLLANTDWTIPIFEDDPDTSLIFWDFDSIDHDVAINYAMSYLFITYLSEYYGGSGVISALVQNGDFQGIEGVEQEILNSYGKSFEEVFVEWIGANYFDDISFEKFGYSTMDVHTKPTDTIVLSPTNSSVTVSDTVDYWAADTYLLKDFNGTISLSFNGVNNGDFNVSLVNYNRVQNRVTYLPLNSNQDGSITLSMYDNVILFITNVKGDNSLGGYWEEQGATNSAYSFTITLDSSTVTLDNAIVTVDDTTHKLNVTGITISNQTITWNEADIVGLEIWDIKGNPSQLAYELTYNDQTSSWEGLNLDIESLPSGNYFCRIFAAKGEEGGTIDSISFVILDSPDYWKNWLSDPDDGVDPIIDVFNVSCHLTDTHFLVKLELEAAPSLDASHEYWFLIDLDVDGSSEWQAYWSDSNLESYWIRGVDSWAAQNIHYALGNNIIFKLPLREFSSIYEMNVRAYASDLSNTDFIGGFEIGGY
ncbi:MAG: hypothetical protein ACFFDT_37770, partial [Candidatus Hodarchaeota archaeon]